MILKLCCVVGLLAQIQFSTSGSPTETETVPVNEPKIICHYNPNPPYKDTLDGNDVNYCTHIVYVGDMVGFPSLTFFPFPTSDALQSLHSRISDLRSNGIYVLFSLRFFNIRRFQENASRTVAEIVEFIQLNRLNGFEIYRDYRDETVEGSSELFAELLRQLSEAFKPRHWILSSTFVYRPDVDQIDFPKISEYVDWLTAVSKPISHFTATALVYPLYSYPGDGDVVSKSAANFIVSRLIEMGVPSTKLLVPFITFGLKFRLASEKTGLNAACTNELYDALIHEICQKVTGDRWRVVHDADRVGTYAHDGEFLISYNAVEDAQRRADYVIQNNLGGSLIILLNTDDPEGKCGCGKNPLTRAFAQSLRNVTGPKAESCTL